ncbi:MAG TPA: helix-turn-helix transcriptional regulator [Usitatibacter sp.]|jgi:AraC family transcriptional regulator|nr:helix-turn-helix transcriptional regulator [Usitatibacter sp.]
MQRRTYPASCTAVLDDSKVSPKARGHAGFHGLERGVRAISGARGVWVSHPPGQVIGEHRHDWPYLMLPSVGGYVERYEAGDVHVAGPSVVFHPAGTCHANRIGERGMETVTLEFDPDWIRLAGVSLQRSRTWVGGAVAIAAGRLATLWGNASAHDGQVARATSAFLRFALTQQSGPRPEWLDDVQRMLEAPEVPATAEIARRRGLHPAWLARAYRHATGEGIHATVRRRRVERSLLLLRTTDLPPAHIASAAGFFDQSHMIRGFRTVLGRTPMQVRAERELMGSLCA